MAEVFERTSDLMVDATEMHDTSSSFRSTLSSMEMEGTEIIPGSSEALSNRVQISGSTNETPEILRSRRIDGRVSEQSADYDYEDNTSNFLPKKGDVNLHVSSSKSALTQLQHDGSPRKKEFIWTRMGLKNHQNTFEPDSTMSSTSLDTQQTDFSSNKSAVNRNTAHGQPYVKMKSPIKIHKDFSRVIQAQTLSTEDDSTSPHTSDSHQSHKAIWSLKFNTDGRYIALGGQNYVVLVWSVADKSNTTSEESTQIFDERPIREYTGHKADILDLSWSKDERFFLSGSLDCKIRLWNIAEKRVAFWNEVPEGNMVTAVAFTLDGKTACAGSHIGQCFFYDTQELKYNTQISIKDSGKKGRKITGIEPMPGMPPGDEKILITSNDSRVRMYNMKDKSLMFKYKGVENTSMQIKATFSDDGRYIICGSEDGNIFIWGTEQINFSPFHYLQDSRIKAAAAIGNLGEQMIQTVMQSTDEHGQPTRISGWLKRSEKHVQDKLRNRNEHFEAHDSAIAVVAFAPTKTRQRLARSGKDLIYNHTPVYIEKIRRDSTKSEKAGDEQYVCGYEEAGDDVRENYTYPEGHIMVSADTNGCIKVWRMDTGKYDINKDDTSDSRSSSTSIPPPRVDSLQSNKAEGSRNVISAPGSPRNRLHFGNLFSSQNRSKRVV
ncbi:WD repeat-containing protein 44 [Apophysomyces sp. BC1034]|nr:WD repeat-containing protein 44 [Apophysomyces sp. BC1015]KAG0169227.1 WD repeat-containing protein 44 [Apophysomyces sp. BC1021]KAG0184326.1 WD repeat-containing protein 44 [Apophysomyces sp. BC1034]